MAELVDALDSKSSVFTGVWVRVPPSAPLEKEGDVVLNTLTRCVGAERFPILHDIKKTRSHAFLMVAGLFYEH